MRILVTGTAGFIGYHLAERLLGEGHEVFGVDGFTDYYDVALKRARHARLKTRNGFSEHVLMLEDATALREIADAASPEVIVHLAAQAGVRYSLDHPETYASSNLVGTFHVLEEAKRLKVRHLLLASTSSVYGANAHMPFREVDQADHPFTFYAATKKAGEAMSHSYSHLWDIPTTAFRFFTVYGPWGRPDMALFKFVEAMLQGRPIDVYNNGQMSRDFTYVDDLIEGVVRLIDTVPVRGAPIGLADSLSPAAPWRVVNVGGGQPETLLAFIEAIEACLGQPAVRNYLPMQPGDVPATWCDATLLEDLTGYKPSTPVSEGVAKFVTWYRQHYSA